MYCDFSDYYGVVNPSFRSSLIVFEIKDKPASAGFFMLKFCIAVDDLEMVKISCKNNQLNDLNHLENRGHTLSEKKADCQV